MCVGGLWTSGWRTDGTRKPVGMDSLAPAEVLLLLGPRAALSHEEAARRLGIELADDTGKRRVTVPRNVSRVLAEGWVVLRRDLADTDVDVQEGLRITRPGRTVRDLAGVLPLAHAVAAADSALRHSLVIAPVLQRLLAGAMGRGAAGIRAVGALLDPGSGSVLESLFRVLVVSASLPLPVTQHLVRNEFGAVVARVDFCWLEARLVVEVDGFAFHSDREAYRRDRWRMNELERLGWRVLRITWEDVHTHPEILIDLVSECLAA